jgi:pSer/pThr/pTyr-binding forkhead associated (FHA) protein
VTARSAGKVSLLPREIGGLSRTDPAALPGTLFVLGSNGGMKVAPDAGFTLLFGRNEPEVHVWVGADDTRVSRRHGLIVRESSRSVIHADAHMDLRLFLLPSVPRHLASVLRPAARG